MPLRPTAPRLRVESLEDRVTPTVSAALNGAGTLTVTLDAASDTATVTGTGAGTDIDVTGTGFATQSFTAVNAIIVVDNGGNAGQSVTFTATGPAAAINLPGAVTINGVESVAIQNLSALSLGIANATTSIQLTGDVTTTGTAGQVYGGPVTIGDAVVTAVTLTAGATGGVDFKQAVNGFAADADTLTVNAGAATQFEAAVGSGVRLGSLSTDAPGTTILGANVTTGADQSYADPVTISGSSVALTSATTGVAFLGTLNATSATSPGNGVTVFAPGTTRFAAAVGGLIPLSSVSTDSAGTTQIDASVATTGAQAYSDQVVVSGAAVTLSSSGNGAITISGTLAGAVADTTSLAVSTAGVTTFAGPVGTTRLLSLTTDVVGSTTLGSGQAAITVDTSGGQSFFDAVQVNVTTTATFTSSAAGAITFGGTLGGTAANTAVAVNTAGATTFGGVVGGNATAPTLLTLTTDGPGTTVLGAPVNTKTAQSYADPVTVTPSTGVAAVTLTTTTGSVVFGGTITGAAVAPFAVRASANVTLGGNVTLSATGSSFTAQVGTSGTGVIVIPAGTTIRADGQTYRAGDGPGTLTTATVDLLTNAPQLRNAAGTAAPVSFTLRQDEAITDATLPAAAQFGGTFPRSVALVSDDGALALNSTTVAGAQTIDVLLSAAQAVTVGTAVSAPNGTIRLRSGSMNVTQTAAGTLTATAVGVRAATGIDLSLAPNAVTTFAAQSTNGDVKYVSATPVTVGVVTTDPLTGVFPATAGGQTGTGAVTFTPSGTTALDLTVAAPLAGTTVAATGGAGDDRVTVSYALGATLANGLVFTGGGGTDSLVVTDSGATVAHTYTVNGNLVRDTSPAITLPGVESLSVTGGTAADTFTVTPDANFAVTVAGGGPTTGTGDALSLNISGGTGPVLTSSRTSTGLQGSAAFVNLQTVAFSQIETVTPSGDIRVTATTTAAIASGETGTVTVTVTNVGPSAVTNLPLTNLIPAGLTATWQAGASGGSSVAAVSGTGDISTTANLAVGGTATFLIQFTAAGTARGTITNTFTAGASPTAFELDTTNNSAATTITVQTGATELFAVGAGPGGGPAVVAYNPDGTERFRRFAFDTVYSGGVSVGTGDLNGDGFEDVVAGSAAGASRVTVFDGRTGDQITTFFAFPDFTGGVNVAVAGGRIVVGAGNGGAPVVAQFALVGGAAKEVTRFFAFDSGFRGGVQVGGSDTYLVVGAGPGGGPHVKVFDAASLVQTASFFAFKPGTTDGVSVAIGGTAAAPTVLVGSGLGSSPVAVTFNAVTLASAGSFQAFEASFRGGVRVASGGTTSDKTTTVVAPGGGGSSRVRIVNPDNSTLKDFFAFESTFTGGVFVG